MKSIGLEIDCDICNCQIRIPGALVFSPPNGHVTVKRHVCTACWPLVLNLFNKNTKDGKLK